MLCVGLGCTGLDPARHALQLNWNVAWGVPPRASHDHDGYKVQHLDR